MRKILRLLFCAIFTSGLVAACGTSIGNSEDNIKSEDCGAQLCDERFGLLVFAGSGPIVLKIGQGRFFRIDSDTSEKVLEQFKYLNRGPDLNYVAYGGHLDGDITYSKGIDAEVILLRYVRDVRQLPDAESRQLRSAFSQ